MRFGGLKMNSKELKKSIYIQKDNMELLEEFLNKNPSLNSSKVVNEALSLYLSSVKFNGDVQIKKDNSYVLCVVRLHKVLVNVLNIFKSRYKSRGVIEFINGHLLKALSIQHFEQFPRKDNMGFVYIKNLAEKVKMRLVRKRC